MSKRSSGPWAGAVEEYLSTAAVAGFLYGCGTNKKDAPQMLIMSEYGRRAQAGERPAMEASDGSGRGIPFDRRTRCPAEKRLHDEMKGTARDKSDGNSTRPGRR